jgi:hypothetical protein
VTDVTLVRIFRRECGYDTSQVPAAGVHVGMMYLQSMCLPGWHGYIAAIGTLVCALNPCGLAFIPCEQGAGHVDTSVPLTPHNLVKTLKQYPIVVVKFCTTWSSWCERMNPAWEAATQEVHDKYPGATDGRVRYVEVRGMAGKYKTVAGTWLQSTLGGKAL